MEEVVQIALKLQRLENCGELRIVYVEDLGAKALVMTNSDKFCIAVDPALSYEQQIKEIWHEAKHIYSHLNKTCSISIAEKEAEEFSEIAVKYPEILVGLSMVDNLVGR